MDLSGVERVEGGGYGEPNRDGPGSMSWCAVMGKVALFMAMSHVTVWGDRTAPRRPLCKGACERSPL